MSRVTVRNTRAEDFPAITAISTKVYPFTVGWRERELSSHLEIFPEGQLVAVDGETDRVLGMSANLIVDWDDYELGDTWRDLTDGGRFTNHDPVHGRTLYGAEVMVDPDEQGKGVGSALYEARFALVKRLGLVRIRAGARLRGYHRVTDRMSAGEYVRRVQADEIQDPTLSFQLHRGFRVIAVVSGYLRADPESLGWAAVIEWLNPDVERPPSP